MVKTKEEKRIYMREYMRKKYKDPEFMEKHKESCKRSKKKNPEKYRENYKKWVEANRDHVNEYARNFRLKRKQKKEGEDEHKAG